MSEQRILKYELTEEGKQSILLPERSKILKVGYQGRQLCVWVIGCLENPEEYRCFRIFGTGFNVESIDSLTYVDTCTNEIGFVGHIFEEKMEVSE